MLRNLWRWTARWRTWIVNVLFASPILIETIMVLVGFDWGTILPREYVPYVILAQSVLNVWMRPRRAVLAGDPETRVGR